MDLVYILKTDSRNNYTELRFSLRSLVNIKFDRIFVIGGKPIWIQNVIHIPAEDPFELKALNALHKIKIACQDDRISEDFILMNDDFFVMKPIQNLPYYYKGSFKTTIADYEARYNTSKYLLALKRTSELFKNGSDFSIHCPIIYNKKKFLDLEKHYDLSAGYLLRSLYCNHYKVEKIKVADFKIHNLPDMYQIGMYYDRKFLSSNDSFGEKVIFQRSMLGHFPERSKFEEWSNIETS